MTSPIPPSSPSPPPAPPAAPPPPSSPSAPITALLSTDTLTTSGGALSSLSADPSINDFVSAIKVAQLSFSHDLYKIEFENPAQHKRFAMDLASEMSSALEVYRQLRLNYVAATVGADQTDLYTQQTNSSAQTANTNITDTQQQAAALNAETDNYNTAADDFNTQNEAGFPSTVDRDAAIDQYNAAANAYNASVDAYNNSATLSNTAIDQYNLQVDQQNAQIDANNVQIDQTNIQRQSEGKDPLPYQEHIPYKDQIPLASHVATLPYADVTTPIAHQSPVAIPTTIEIQTLPGDLSFFNDYLKTSFMPFFESARRYKASIDEGFEVTLRKLGLPRPSKENTRPEAFIKQREFDTSEVSGTGAGHLATLSTGLDNPRLNSILSDGLVDQVFTNYHVNSSFQLLERILPFTLGMFRGDVMRGTFPGLGVLGPNPLGVPPDSNAIRISQAIGTTASLLGSLNTNALEKALGNLVSNTPGLENLEQDTKTDVTKTLNALVSDALIKLVIGSLVRETQSPGLLKAVDAALITSQPQSANERFPVVQNSFAELNSSFGTDTVSELLNQYLTSELGKGPNGFDQNTSARIATLVSSSVGEQGLPPTATELNQQISALLPPVFGSTLPPDLAQSITSHISLFTLAASAKSELQDQLISDVGPKQSTNLTDQTIQRLFGFSVDFSEPQIVQRAKGETGGLSLVSALQNNLRVIDEQNNATFSQKVKEDFDSTHESITKLDSFLREVIDPGQQLYGLMYEQTHGNIPRSKKDIVDIPL